jgi:hypothetical protein
MVRIELSAWRIDEGVGEDTFEDLVFKALRATRPKAQA